MRTKNWGFLLTDAIEALTVEGCVVLTADQAEAVTALLGALAYDETDFGTPWRNLLGRELAWKAEEILAGWPSSHESNDR